MRVYWFCWELRCVWCFTNMYVCFINDHLVSLMLAKKKTWLSLITPNCFWCLQIAYISFSKRPQVVFDVYKTQMEASLRPQCVFNVYKHVQELFWGLGRLGWKFQRKWSSLFSHTRTKNAQTLELWLPLLVASCAIFLAMVIQSHVTLTMISLKFIDATHSHFEHFSLWMATISRQHPCSFF